MPQTNGAVANGAASNGDTTTNGEHTTNGDPLTTTSYDTLWTQAQTSLLRYTPSFVPKLIVRASGSFVYAADGQPYLDFTSGQMSCLLGHGHPEIVSTITSHARSLDHLFSAMVSPPVAGLAHALTGLLPAGLDKAMFLSTGGESNEAAIKLAKTYTGRWEIVGLAMGWHGTTGGAAGVTFHSGRRGHGPMVPGNLVLPAPDAYRSPFRHPDGTYDWRTELDHGWSLVDAASVGSLAAVILEPVLSAGGMLTLPRGYLAAMQAHCRARGMLLIVDEAQTALGRCGALFGFEHPSDSWTTPWERDPEPEPAVVPDILTLSKTLGNGLPLSAVVTSAEIEAACAAHDFLFYTTHVNDPLPCAVGLKVLEIVQRDELVSRARRLGGILHAGLTKLQSRYGVIGDVRGRGLMAGVELVRDREAKTPAPEVGVALCDKMLELGLSANIKASAAGGVFRFAPPITITEEELALGLELMERAFADTEGTMPMKGV